MAVKIPVRPQPQQPQASVQTSPYKNKVPPGINQAQLARSPLPVVTPRAPDVTRCGSKDDSSDYGPVSGFMKVMVKFVKYTLTA